MLEKLREEILKVIPRINRCETCKLHQAGNYTRKDCITYGKRECAYETVILDQIISLIRQYLEPLEETPLQHLKEEMRLGMYHGKSSEDRVEEIAQIIYNNYREPYCLVPEWEWAALPIKEEYRKVARQICQIPVKVRLPENPYNDAQFYLHGGYDSCLKDVTKSLQKAGIEVE